MGSPEVLIKVEDKKVRMTANEFYDVLVYAAKGIGGVGSKSKIDEKTKMTILGLQFIFAKYAKEEEREVESN